MDSSPLSTAPPTPTPTDPLDTPLPLPTTLGSHLLGPRYLRSASRATSTLSSRSSSRAHRSEGISSLESLSMDYSARDSFAAIPLEGSNSNAGPASTSAGPSNPRSLMDRVLIPPVQRPRRRRRGYSIHDEIDPAAQDVPVQLSTSAHSTNSPTMDDTQPPTKKRRITNAKKATKRRSSRNATANANNTEAPSILPSTQTRDTSSELDVTVRFPDVNIDDESTEVKIEASSPPPVVSTSNAPAVPSPPISSEPLSEYPCPICLSPPTNATLTPCGHICCGECLFTAVRSTMQRAAANIYPREPVVARCPVCRATLIGWDGRGGGVIGLQPRSVISL